MRRLFQVEVPIHATLYVFAEDADAAKRLASETCMDAQLELSDRTTGDIPVFGGMYDDPDMPAVSFSPAVTVGTPEIGGLYENDGFDAEAAHAAEMTELSRLHAVAINDFHDTNGAAYGVIEEPGMENGDRWVGQLHKDPHAARIALREAYDGDDRETLKPAVARWDREGEFWSYDGL